ncbi:hypothetical protein C4K26_1067 [Pseudomonas chlororaphis]|nr:hypothetical protein C4K26_1067 [Pseudomonas chlororaphis]
MLGNIQAKKNAACGRAAFSGGSSGTFIASKLAPTGSAQSM